MGNDDKLFSFLFKTLAMLNDEDSIAVIIGNASREYQITPADVIEWARTKKYEDVKEEKQMLYNAYLMEEKLSNMGCQITKSGSIKR